MTAQTGDDQKSVKQLGVSTSPLNSVQGRHEHQDRELQTSLHQSSSIERVLYPVIFAKL
jgi:hypothetical protein